MCMSLSPRGSLSLDGNLRPVPLYSTSLTWLAESHLINRSQEPFSLSSRRSLLSFQKLFVSGPYIFWFSCVYKLWSFLDKLVHGAERGWRWDIKANKPGIVPHVWVIWSNYHFSYIGTATPPWINCFYSYSASLTKFGQTDRTCNSHKLLQICPNMKWNPKRAGISITKYHAIFLSAILFVYCYKVLFLNFSDETGNCEIFAAGYPK